MAKDNRLTKFAARYVAEKMFDRVFVSYVGVERNGVFKLSPDALELKEEYVDQVIDLEGERVEAEAFDLPF